MKLSEKNFAKYIDNTNLKPEATSDDIKKLCDEAKQYNFASVCVNPCFVSSCKTLLNGFESKVCTVIGFPLGASTTETKLYEAEGAIKDGAEEIDMVINIGKLKEGDYNYVKNEIKEIVSLARETNVLTKVIIETCLLTNEEKMKMCEIVMDAGADFIKTSTGFSKDGATVEDIKLMKSIIHDKIGIKASGGIKDYEKTMDMIEAGATRIGTSSGANIVMGFKEKDN
jgi:deoxyribose-phosphate aldolase